jgi:hypothetical protein
LVGMPEEPLFAAAYTEAYSSSAQAWLAAEGFAVVDENGVAQDADPVVPDLVNMYTPIPTPLPTPRPTSPADSSACSCDPRKHISVYTTCTLVATPEQHVVVHHSRHKQCHPLAPDFFDCAAVRQRLGLHARRVLTGRRFVAGERRGVRQVAMQSLPRQRNLRGRPACTICAEWFVVCHLNL